MVSSAQTQELQGSREKELDEYHSCFHNESETQEDFPYERDQGLSLETGASSSSSDEAGGASSKSKGKEKDTGVSVEDMTAPLTETTIEGGEEDLDDKSLEEAMSNTVLCDKEENNEDWTCAICLDVISMEELSLIKGCEHAYCTHCILKWAAFKSEKQSRAGSDNVDPVCPTCKHPFSTLVTARALDGTVKPHLEEESLALLLRALWFAEGASLSRLGISTPPPANAEYYDFCEPDDDDLYDFDEDYYIMHSKASRKVISNRKFGSGGILQSGRMQARPVSNSSGSSHKSKGNGNKADTPAKKIQGCSSAASPADCTPKPAGRRAKRNAKRRQCSTV